jgi:hypothetical protein
MPSLTEYTVEDLHHLCRNGLITLLVEHDRDGDYADTHRLALGHECLNHQEALELCVNHLNEYLDGLVSFYKSI